MKSIIQKFRENPALILLVDSIGGLLTALSIFGIVRTFNEYIGVPKTTLTYLSLLGLLYSVYSMTCFLSFKDNWKPFLSFISKMNLLYCLLTLGLMVYYRETITLLGIVYFVSEIIIISGLSYIEIKMINNQK
ncbi:MAG: hypothetical protein SFU98_19025 [Leptospiraceae bacterium]|nr:hypothetical protein [Leptospiraceae bacterium]